MTKEVLLCDCNSTNHQIIIIYDEDEKDPSDKMVFMYTCLNKPSFWRRLQYLFGFQKYAFEDFIFNPEDADKLQKVVDYLRK